ncbi:YceI family protein [Novosphingobium sp. HBC54]|uniref:YceI family protein n=2 Tax=Novosphingobium cyanobacteriorum TaxID=3024215 RepID=A0ABT6CCJ3_9SPHN|nr:YceI family protein [Novosphingobium cyanobacteriorum]MDF8331649.1 YceI family protein [Novosphingobium cyanobacteriorum]
MPQFTRIMKYALPAALAAVVAAPIVAQMPAGQPGAADKARVTAGTYVVDAGHAQIGWRLNHMGFNDTLGLIGGETGTLTLDPANPAASKVSISIPVAKLVSADAGLTAHLMKPAGANGKADFFGANPAPATFESTSVAVGADGTSAKVAGNLTLNGATKPVTVDVTFVGAGKNPMKGVETVGFHGTATIKRSDFGLGYAVPVVGDDVSLTISIAFEKKA